MYNINDKPEATRAIQRMLGINESGIYDERTRAAVIDVQAEAGYTSDGLVDLKTFEEIRRIYDVRARAECVRRLVSVEFPYREGDYGDHIYSANELLAKTLSFFSHEHLLPRGYIYTSSTSLAVARLREIFALEDKAEIDGELYLRMLEELGLI
ncbi:MAG: peptidoglycan-binding protein [Clostridia bacterium]|nr:peptidoglycan-binding protein [Clostridia bacterium]